MPLASHPSIHTTLCPLSLHPSMHTVQPLCFRPCYLTPSITQSLHQVLSGDLIGIWQLIHTSQYTKPHHLRARGMLHGVVFSFSFGLHAPLAEPGYTQAFAHTAPHELRKHHNTDIWQRSAATTYTNKVLDDPMHNALHYSSITHTLPLYNAFK